MLHAHRAIWKERGLLTSQGMLIKNGKQISDLLENIQKPAEVAIMHYRAHQGGKTKLDLGNHLADKAAEEAAEKGTLENISLIPLLEIPLPVEKSEYSARDCQLIETLEAKFDPRAWAVTPSRQIVVPEPNLA